MTPRRIQRRRAKGWGLPEGAVCVGRSTPWGNPFVVGKHGNVESCVTGHRYLLDGMIRLTGPSPSIEEQRAYLRFAYWHIQELTGHDLACWCRKGQSCHADLLLKIANHPRIIAREGSAHFGLRSEQ